MDSPELSEASRPAPVISVVTVAGDAPRGVLAATAEALLSQTLDLWEWLLIAGGALPAEAVADARVRVLTPTADEAPGVARARALALARADIVVVLDSADRLERTALETWAWLMTTQPRVSLADASVEADDGTLGHGGVAAGQQRLVQPPAVRSYAVRRSAIDEAGGFDEGLVPPLLDWDVALRVAAAGGLGAEVGHVLARRPRVPELPSSAAVQEFLAERRRRWPDLFASGPPEYRVSLDAHQMPLALERRPPFRAGPITADGRGLVAIAPWLRVGGSERALLETLRQLRGRGWRPTVVATAAEPHEWLKEFRDVADGDVLLAQDALNPTPFPLPLRTEPAFLAEIVRTRAARVVLLSNTVVGLGCVPLLRRCMPGLAVAEIRHAPYWPPLTVDASRLLDLTLASSHAVRDALVAGGADPERTVAYSTCVDARRFRPDREARNAVRRARGIADETTLVVFAARLWAVKQPLVAVHVIERLRARGHDVRALFVGGGPQADEVRAAAAAPEVAGAVELTGHVDSDELPRLLAAADVCLLPSIDEGIALGAFEALACGVPFVGARVGAQHELVTPECGVLVTPTGTPDGDVAAYTAALDDLLRRPGRLAELGRAGRARIEREFTLDRMGDTIAARLDDALVRAVGPRPPPTDPDPDWTQAAFAVQAGFWYSQWRSDLDLSRQDLEYVKQLGRVAEQERDAARDELAGRVRGRRRSWWSKGRD
ncbi:MAG: glycosyltransferase [Actinomycetota bacterium]|nr:glycosyltransferase [Actinomycetota bacterium]